MDEYLIQEEIYKNVRIRVYSDPDPLNPFEAWDHAPSFGLAIRGYELGLDPAAMELMLSDFFEFQNEESVPEYLNQYECPNCGNMWEEYKDTPEATDNCTACEQSEETAPCGSAEEESPYKEMREFCEQYDWLRVFKYEHSGVAFNTTGFSCPWDSGCVGIAYVKKEDSEVCNTETYLKGQVSLLHAYASGSVYGFVCTGLDADGNEDDSIYEDSCWGFYDADDKEVERMVKECKDAIDSTLNVDNFVLEG